MPTDGGIYETKLIVTFRSFAKTSKNHHPLYSSELEVPTRIHVRACRPLTLPCGIRPLILRQERKLNAHYKKICVLHSTNNQVL